MARVIEVTDLILRDAQQSLLESSMSLEDVAPACEDLDNAGYWSLECWGGASFESHLRFRNEDPWESLRAFRKLLPKTRLQMLLRGQNLVGYRSLDDTVVSRFVEKAAQNGIDVFRTFDALNDVRNLKAGVDAVVRVGKHAQGAICYAPSPVNTAAKFVEIAQRLKDMGCDSICVRDGGGFLKPQAAFDLVKGIKDKCGQDTLVHVHTHSTTGVTMVSLMKAVEAGCDMVDTAISSLALGRGHNPTESFAEMLEGTGFKTRLDLERILRIKRHFANVRVNYREFSSAPIGIETEIFSNHIPAPMVSNIEFQLMGQGSDQLLPEVLSEVQDIVHDAGSPALVTPAGQIVGTQAVLNVLQGKYKTITSEFADLMLGYYGSTLGAKNAEVMEMASARTGKGPITCRPADLLASDWPRMQAEATALSGCDGSDEDVLTYAMFPQAAAEFFKSRTEGPNVGKEPSLANSEREVGGGSNDISKSTKKYVVTLNGEEHRVTVTPAE